MQVLSSARYRSDCSVGIGCGCRLRGRCSPSDQLCASAEPSHEEKVGGSVNEAWAEAHGASASFQTKDRGRCDRRWAGTAPSRSSTSVTAARGRGTSIPIDQGLTFAGLVATRAAAFRSLDAPAAAHRSQ